METQGAFCDEEIETLQTVLLNVRTNISRHSNALFDILLV